jgi:hypothetical protein
MRPNKDQKMADRETIIDTGGGDSGSGVATGLIVAAVIIVLLIAGGFLVFNHGGSSGSVTLNVPKVTVDTPKS